MKIYCYGCKCCDNYLETKDKYPTKDCPACKVPTLFLKEEKEVTDDYFNDPFERGDK